VVLCGLVAACSSPLDGELGAPPAESSPSIVPPGGAMKLAHAVYRPPGDGPFPTIVAFHGYGSNALDLLSLAPFFLHGQALVIAPQGPDPVSAGPPGSGAPQGFGWFPLTLVRPPTPLDVAQAVTGAREFLDAAVERYPVDRKRLVVLGFSQGGVIAYALALSAPERFRALVALSSWLPDDLANALPQVDRSSLQTWIAHGRHDEIIMVARGRSSAERVRAMGAPVTYREYDMGHEVSGPSLTELIRWLDERLKP
jgi:phospholipase/carboxylesterase